MHGACLINRGFNGVLDQFLLPFHPLFTVIPASNVPKPAYKPVGRRVGGSFGCISCYSLLFPVYSILVKLSSVRRVLSGFGAVLSGM